MKEIKRGLLIGIVIAFCLLSSSLEAEAQEIRQSQYYSVMPAINPAATGAFGGDYRFLANYRNSTYSASAKPFTTIYASYDQGIAKYRKDGQSRQSFFGAGISFLKDKAGIGDLSLTEINLMISYNLRIGTHNHLTVGFKAGQATRAVSYSTFRWGSQYSDENGTYDPDKYSDPLANNNKTTYVPISTGLMWNFSNPDKFKLNAGLALNRLNSPNAAFDSEIKEKIPLQMAVNFGAEWMVPNTVLALMPLLLYQRQDYYSEVNFGILAKFLLSFDSHMTHKKKTSSLYAGAFYRSSGDLIFSGKFDLRQNMALGLSYDVAFAGISDAKSISKRGGLEIVLSYYGFFKERSKLPQKGSVEFF